MKHEGNARCRKYAMCMPELLEEVLSRMLIKSCRMKAAKSLTKDPSEPVLEIVCT